MQRRTWFKWGLTSAVVLVAGGAASGLLQPGLKPSGKLNPVGREVFSAIGLAVLDQSLPQQAAARQVALTGLLQRIDTLVQSLPPHAQAELSQLLSLLGSGMGRRTLAGLQAPWAGASIGDVQQALQGMRLSALAVRQQTYAALHDIATGAYFADATTWSQLGYPGPLKI